MAKIELLPVQPGEIVISQNSLGPYFTGDREEAANKAKALLPSLKAFDPQLVETRRSATRAVDVVTDPMFLFEGMEAVGARLKPYLNSEQNKLREALFQKQFPSGELTYASLFTRLGHLLTGLIKKKNEQGVT